MKDEIKALDAALGGERDASDFGETYPDAPEWAVEMAAQLEEHRATLDRKKQARRQRLETLHQRLKKRTAALAVQAGVATEEEKRVAKAAAGAGRQSNNSDGLADYFSPQNGMEDHR